MKAMFFTSSLVLLSLTSFAQSLETDLNFLEFKTSSPVYRTEYIYEDYQTTCTRSIYVGTRQECEEVTETRCRKIAGVGEECWQESTGNTCTSIPDYEYEDYPCIATRKVPTKVWDHDVTTIVKVNLPENAKEFDLKDCSLDSTSTDFHSTLTAKCLGTIIRAEILSQENTQARYSRELRAKLTYEKLDNYKGLLGGLNINKVDKKNNIIKFSAGHFLSDGNVELRLTATRNRLLAKDKVVFSKILSASDLIIDSDHPNSSVNYASYSLDLNKLLGNFDNTKKHTFKLELKAKNSRDFSNILNFNLKNSYEDKVVINN